MMDILGLAALVFVLGLKHGLDPDHLAAIDGLTRFNAQRRPRLSRWSGLLFSAGHGVVVTLVAVVVATVATQWHAPRLLSTPSTRRRSILIVFSPVSPCLQPREGILTCIGIFTPG